MDPEEYEGAKGNSFGEVLKVHSLSSSLSLYPCLPLFPSLSLSLYSSLSVSLPLSISLSLSRHDSI